MSSLNKLSHSELEQLQKAPLLVGILIAGADGKIDRKEFRQAVNFLVSNSHSADMQVIMAELSSDTEEKLQVLINLYPANPKEREQTLVDELESLNAILPKLDRIFAINYFLMLKSLAVSIASSSGGLLGIKSVASAEARFINLPMITDPATFP